MARITVEDCLQKVNNRFALIHMASKRVRQLRKGSEPKLVTKNRDIVLSLREIAAGNVVGVNPDEYDMLPEGDLSAAQEGKKIEAKADESENNSADSEE